MADQLLDDLVRNVLGAYLGEKIKGQNILNMNGANLAYTHAIDIAHKLGLPEDYIKNITPFPGSTTTNIVVQNDSEKSKDAESTKKVSDESDGETEKKKKPLNHRILPWVLTAASSLGALGLGAKAFWPEKKVEDPPPIVEEFDPNVGFRIEGMKIDE